METISQVLFWVANSLLIPDILLLLLLFIRALLLVGGSYAIGWAVQLTFGFVAQKVGFLFMPYLLLAFAAALLIVSEITNKVTAKHKVAAEQIS